MEKNYQYDVSIILPSLNEGESVKVLLEEIYNEMRKLNKSFEIIAIDTPSDNPSYPVYVEYAKKYDNFTGIRLSDRRIAGSGKTVQYMIGFHRAKGRYIIQMDSDYQDNPADIHKFIQKLDEGYDLVVGHKQKRKDGAFYVLQSYVGNAFTRLITGTDVHDMNCGFKGYQSYVAKRLNLKGRWYRYIPSLLQAKGYKITEVPIENRKRIFGKSNFNLKNRIQAGLFDMSVVALYNFFSETPVYLFGWISIISLSLAFVTAICTLIFWGGELSILLGVATLMLGFFAGVSLLFGVMIEFIRMSSRTEITEYGIRDIVTGQQADR